jgi:hypothetical protein
MKPLYATLALLVALLPGTLAAQDATPPPNPLIYDDLAMHFQAPDGWYSAGQQKIDLKDLGDDPVPVAAWYTRSGDRPVKMIMDMQHFESSLDAFESAVEQHIRDATADGVIRSKEHIALKNGMPAYFIGVVSGSGFDTTKSYVVAWVDGQRGVQIIVTAQVGFIDADTAKKWMSNVTAVRYPVDRE